jgi:hypothetical protein
MQFLPLYPRHKEWSTKTILTHTNKDGMMMPNKCRGCDCREWDDGQGWHCTAEKDDEGLKACEKTHAG